MIDTAEMNGKMEQAIAVRNPDPDAQDAILYLLSWEDGMRLVTFDEARQQWRERGGNLESLLADAFNDLTGSWRYARLLQSIPVTMQKAVQKFGNLRLNVVQLLRLDTTTAVGDLLADCPVLLMLVVKAVAANRMTASTAIVLCRKRRMAIAAELGLPQRRAVLRWLRLIRLDSWSTGDARILLLILHSAQWQDVFASWQGKAINGSALFHMRHAPQLCVSPTIRRILQSPQAPDLKTIDCYIRLYNTAYQLAQEEGLTKIERLRFMSMRTLQRTVWEMHQHQVCRRIGKMLHQEHGTLTFPAAPLPGTETIVPLKSFTELASAARNMHNCGIELTGQILNGKRYLYLVTAPQHAMLSIHCRPGVWKIDQLKLALNREPSAETRKAVMKWLQKARTAYRKEHSSALDSSCRQSAHSCTR